MTDIKILFHKKTTHPSQRLDILRELTDRQLITRGHDIGLQDKGADKFAVSNVKIADGRSMTEFSRALFDVAVERYALVVDANAHEASEKAEKSQILIPSFRPADRSGANTFRVM